MKNFRLFTVLTLLIIFFSGFSFQSFGESKKERRSDRLKESEKALQYLYKDEPQAKQEIQDAYGYATFKNYGMSMMIMSADGGRGLVKVNKTGKVTFMNMASGGMGMGLGAKEYYSVFIFNDQISFDDFVKHGWEANAEFDASAKSEDSGEALNETSTIREDVKLYKVTKNGAIVQMNVHGSKYWKCKDLN